MGLYLLLLNEGTTVVGTLFLLLKGDQFLCSVFSLRGGTNNDEQSIVDMN